VACRRHQPQPMVWRTITEPQIYPRSTSCYHDGVKVGDRLPFIARRGEEPHFIVCFRCHATLPLGPARDTAETAIEVTAARIIADDFAYWPVMDGFDAWVEDRDDDGVRQHHDHPFFRAGWLAAAIAHHATEHGEG
jgi:hypothetical protein